jgi:hypothetical protein
MRSMVKGSRRRIGMGRDKPPGHYRIGEDKGKARASGCAQA